MEDDHFYDEFNSAFWLTLAGAVFGFLGVCLQAILKSRCKAFSCFGVSCVRDPAPPGMEPQLDLSRLEQGAVVLDSPVLNHSNSNERSSNEIDTRI